MRYFILSLLLSVSLGIHAREVDNYMAWGVDLQDSGPAIDEYMRAKMREAIETFLDVKVQQTSHKSLRA